MELDFDDSVLRGLRGYVRLVSLALGLRGDSSSVQADAALSAYIAVDGHLSRFPDRDVALLWDERHGWGAGVETHSGDDVLIVAYLGRDLLPSPETVAAWARDLLSDTADATDPEVRPEPMSDDKLRHRLAAYLGRFDNAVPAGTARGTGTWHLYVAAW